MDRHLSIVANGFRAAGWLVGIPSVAALLFMIWVLISLRNPTPPDPQYTDIGKYGLVGLLQSGACGLGKVFQFFGGLSRWVAGVLAGVSVLLMLFSAALFYTGRGLHHHATWARITGGLLAVLLLLFSSGLVLGLPRAGAWSSAVILCASVYALWVLGWRFS